MIDDLKKAYSSYQQALYYMPNPQVSRPFIGGRSQSKGLTLPFSLFKQEPKLWYGIGILYDRYGSLEHAEEAFSSVIRMDPGGFCFISRAAPVIRWTLFFDPFSFQQLSRKRMRFSSDWALFTSSNASRPKV